MSNEQGGIGLPPEASKLTRTLILVIASIGFAFDIYELLMLPLIARPALLELMPGATPAEMESMIGKLFFIPAMLGGVFGLLGGYLTDLLGRRRVLTWSILLYAGSAFAAGFSTSFTMLLILRCTTFIGVCVEFVAAVAWLAELFPDHKERERVLGYTQAFSSIGGLLVAGANALAITYGEKNHSLPAIGIPDFLSSLGTIVNPYAAWRYTLMSGIIPAIPLIVIRPFLPESPAWAAKKAAGTLKRPSLGELFQPQYFRTTVVTTLLFACSYGAAFGAIQHLPRIVPGLPEVKEAIAAEIAQAKPATDGKAGDAKSATLIAVVPAPTPAPAVADGKAEPKKGGPDAKPSDSKPAPDPKKEAIARRVGQEYAVKVQGVQEIGGLVGRVLLAILVVRIASRRKLLRIFLIPGLILMPLVFGYAATNGFMMLQVGIFLAGMMTVAQFSFWGNYLPNVYPLHLRGTGESFAANIGGRMIGTSFAWVTTTLAAQSFIPGATPPAKLAATAAIVGTFVYLAALIISTWLPEPDPKMEE